MEQKAKELEKRREGNEWVRGVGFIMNLSMINFINCIILEMLKSKGNSNGKINKYKQFKLFFWKFLGVGYVSIRPKDA